MQQCSKCLKEFDGELYRQCPPCYKPSTDQLKGIYKRATEATEKIDREIEEHKEEIRGLKKRRLVVRTQLKEDICKFTEHVWEVRGSRWQQDDRVIKFFTEEEADREQDKMNHGSEEYTSVVYHKVPVNKLPDDFTMEQEEYEQVYPKTPQ